MLHRREFFRGASLGVGGLFLAPFLRQLEAGTEASDKPARVVFFVQGNGLYPDQMQPEGFEWLSEPDALVDRPLTGHAFARPVAPLEPFADRMCFIHGLSGRVAMGDHGMGMGALGCYPGDQGAVGETIDAALAKSLPGIFPHVGLGIQSFPEDTIIYNVSAWQAGFPLATQCNPLLAHQSLFALAAGRQVQQKFTADTQVLDFLADDVRRIQARLDGAERSKLDRYLDALESISHRQSALVQIADRIALAAPEADEKFARGSYAFQRLAAQLEIAAGALIAGLTNVITVSSGAGDKQTGVHFDGVELGLDAGPINSHEVGHNFVFQGTPGGELHMRTRVRHCELLAGFLRKLDSIPEGDGTMLDNTLIIYLSDCAEGHHPQALEWPLIVIGDLGGRLRTKNRYLRFPWYGKPGHRTVASFYIALLHAVGDRRSHFGLEDPKLKDLDQTGPLTEILA